MGDSDFTGGTCTIGTINNVKTSGKRCNVSIRIQDRVLVREAVTQPGADLSWTACLSIDLFQSKKRRFILDQIDRKQTLEEEQLCYLRTPMEDGLLKSAVMVGDGTIVGDVVDTPVTLLEQPPHSEEVPADTVHAEVLAAETPVEQGPQGVKVLVESERVHPLVDVDECVQVERKRSLVPEDVVASVLGEVDGKQAGGSAGAGIGQDLLVQTIMSQTPTSQLAQATEADLILTNATALANTLSERYYWQEHLLFRTRLDKIGDTKEQLGLPAEY